MELLGLVLGHPLAVGKESWQGCREKLHQPVHLLMQSWPSVLLIVTTIWLPSLLPTGSLTAIVSAVARGAMLWVRLVLGVLICLLCRL